MKRKIFFSIAIMIVSMALIIGAIFLFKQVPNVETFTPKEAGIMALGTMMCISAITGIISSFVYLGYQLDD